MKHSCTSIARRANLLLYSTLAFCWLSGGIAGLTAQADEPRLIDRPPFDRIILKDKERPPIDVELLVLPGRKLPQNPRISDKLRLSLLDHPGELYEVRWGEIGSVKLYEDLVLEEANRLVTEGKLDDAFDYFQFLERNHPEYPGVREATTRYLFEDAKALARDDRQLNSLAVLLEVHNRQAYFPELQRAISRIVAKLIESTVQQEDYLNARRYLSQLKNLYPSDEAVINWESQLLQRAEADLAQATTHWQKGETQQAYDAATSSVRTWPALTGATELLAQMQSQQGRVSVAVSGLTSPAGRILDWSEERIDRLTNRKLMERVGYGADGGIYNCPLGKFEAGNLGIDFSFTLRSDLAWTNRDSTLSGNDLARQLWKMADPKSAQFRRDWADIYASARVEDVFTVQLRLTRPFMRPEALLLVNVEPWEAAYDDPGARAALGPYVADARDADSARYQLFSRYFAVQPTQLKTVIERRYENSDAAIHALLDGDVVVLDRVVPWELQKVREAPQITVEPYIVPTVHCLLPNPSRPLMSNRMFRRAILYGIPREGILTKKLMRNRAADGSQVLSAPFPTGYAYGPQVEEVAYDPRLAWTLANAARRELAGEVVGDDSKAGGDKAPQPDNAEKPDTPVQKTSATSSDAAKIAMPRATTLMLVHPADDIARRACGEIARHLTAAGMPIELRELGPDESPWTIDDFDLLYLELTGCEPAVDARRLLGSGGLVRRASPHMDLALSRLEHADDWQKARELLSEIRLLNETELGLIPLWQLTDYLAYHQSVQGIGSKPTTLYQNIEQWQASPWSPPDAP